MSMTLTYINVMRAWDNMRGFETTKVTSNNWETGYEAKRVTSACTFLVGRCLQNICLFMYAVGDVRHTAEGVSEAVGWRRRDETGVNPTEIGVPSTINRVISLDMYHEWKSLYLVGEGHMFQGTGIHGLGDKELRAVRANFRHAGKPPTGNRCRKK